MGSSRMTKLASIVAMVGLTTALFAAGGGGRGGRGEARQRQRIAGAGAARGADRPAQQHRAVAHGARDHGGRRDQRRRRRARKAGDVHRGRRRHRPQPRQRVARGPARGRKVGAIVGPTSSGVTLNILDEVRRRGVLLCSGSNFSAELSTTDSGRYYFRTTPSDRLEGPALAELVLKDGRKVGILARRDTYGVGLATSVKKALDKGGAKVVADVTYDPDATSFDRDVKKVVDKKPGAVVVLGFESDGSDIVRTLTAQGLSPQQFPIYTADGMRTNVFPTLLDPNNPAAAAGIKGTSPATQAAGVQHPFLGAFNDRHRPDLLGLLLRLHDPHGAGGREGQVGRPGQDEERVRRQHKGKNKCSTYAAVQAAPRRRQGHRVPGSVGGVQEHEQVRDVRAQRRRVRDVGVRRIRAGRHRATGDPDSHRLTRFAVLNRRALRRPRSALGGVA